MFAGVVCALAVAGPADKAAAQAGGQVAPTVTGQTSGQRFDVTAGEPEFLLFELRLGQLSLDEAFPGLLVGNTIMLPLGLLAEILQFDIAVDTEASRANGWFIRENRLFSLTANTGEVVIEGERSVFDRRRILREPDDIYIDVRLLARWFPIDMRVDLPNLRVEMESREPLPLEEALEREARFALLQGRRRSRKELPRIETPFRLFSIPTVDISADYGTDSFADGSSDRRLAYNLLAAGDLAFFTGELFLAGLGEDLVTDARFRLDRIDPDGYEIWRLPVRQLSIGDVTMPAQPLIANAQLGRGVVLSNRSLDTPDEFDRISLIGELPLGWEVELLRNGILLDFQTSRADGLYEFIDVPLVYGVNVLQLNFFGPQGQRRSETRQIRVGAEQLKPGEWSYKWSLNEHGEPLFPGVNEGSEDRLRGRARRGFSLNRGMSRSLTLGLNTASLPVDDDRSNYLGGNAVWSPEGWIFRIDGMNQLDAGWAAAVSGQSTVLGFSVFGEYDHYSDFVSERASGGEGNRLINDTELRIEGSFLVLAIQQQFSIGLTGQREEREGGNVRNNINNRISGAIARASFSNTLDWSRNESSDGNDQFGSGRFILGGRIDPLRVPGLNPLQLRGEVSYSFQPVLDLTSGTATLEWPVRPDITGRVSMTYELQPDPRGTYVAGYNVRLGWAYVGLNLEYVDEGDLSALLTMSASVGPDPRSKRPWMSDRQMARTGSFLGSAYLDHNANGVRDEGDEPMEGVRFAVNGQSSPQATDASGVAYVRGLEAYRRLDVQLDTESLEDPFLTPLDGGISLVTRPGSRSEFEFAVVTTGEIDGTVFRVFEDSASPVSGAVVQLVDAEGAIVREVRSAFDGFYLIDFVTPGRYQVRIAPDQLDKLRLNAQPQMVQITGEGSVVSNTDFVLTSAGAAGTVIQPGADQGGLRRPSQSTLPGGSN